MCYFLSVLFVTSCLIQWSKRARIKGDMYMLSTLLGGGTRLFLFVFVLKLFMLYLQRVDC